MQTKEQLKKWLDEDLASDANDLIEFFNTHEERRAIQLFIRDKLNLAPEKWSANFMGFEGNYIILADRINDHGLFYSTYIMVEDADDADDTVKCIPECFAGLIATGTNIDEMVVEVDTSDILVNITDACCYADMIVIDEVFPDTFITTPDQYQLDVEEEERAEEQFYFEEGFEPVLKELETI